jgi:hypothetical protein
MFKLLKSRFSFWKLVWLTRFKVFKLNGYQLPRKTKRFEVVADPETAF